MLSSYPQQNLSLMLVDEPRENWACSLCTFVNAPGQAKCTMCDSKALPRSQQRSCSNSNRTTPEKYAQQQQRSSVAFGLSTPTKYSRGQKGSPNKYSRGSSPTKYSTPPKHGGGRTKSPQKYRNSPSPSNYSTPPKHSHNHKSLKPVWKDSPKSCLSMSEDENTPPHHSKRTTPPSRRKTSPSSTRMQLSTTPYLEQKKRGGARKSSGKDYVTGSATSKHQCPHCHFSWPLSISAPECPKCWKPLHNYTAKTAARYGVLTNSSPSSAMMHVEGKCRKGTYHHYKFGKCQKCGQDEGKLAARGAFASPKDVMLHSTCIVNEGGKHFFKFAECTLCGKPEY